MRDVHRERKSRYLVRDDQVDALILFRASGFSRTLDFGEFLLLLANYQNEEQDDYDELTLAFQLFDLGRWIDVFHWSFGCCRLIWRRSRLSGFEYSPTNQSTDRLKSQRAGITIDVSSGRSKWRCSHRSTWIRSYHPTNKLIFPINISTVRSDRLDAICIRALLLINDLLLYPIEYINNFIIFSDHHTDAQYIADQYRWLWVQSTAGQLNYRWQTLGGFFADRNQCQSMIICIYRKTPLISHSDSARLSEIHQQSINYKGYK